MRQDPILFPAVAYLIGVAAGLYVLATFGFIDLWLANTAGNDFSAIWAGPHVLASGGDPYDAQSWQATVDRLGVQPSGTRVYTYPGWIPLFLFPFGLLALPTAAFIWMSIGFTVGATALFALLYNLLRRRSPISYTLFGYALFASEPSIVAFYSGQWTFLIVGLLCLAVLFVRDRAGASAGLAASIMLAKPQLFALALPALARAAYARRLGRAIVAAAIVMVVAAVASTVVFPQWWAAYLSVPTQQSAHGRSTTIPIALVDVFEGPGLAAGVLIVLAFVAVAFAFSPRTDAYLAAWLAVSLVGAIYEWAYDHTIVLVPLALATGVIARRDRTRAFVVAAAGTLTLTLGSTALHAVFGPIRGTLSFNAFAQMFVAILILAGLWPFRKDDGLAGEAEPQ